MRRFFLSLSASLAALALHAALRFDSPRWLPDLAISVPPLKDAKADPFELPRAQSFLVTSPSGDTSLEDRFNVLDLWSSLTLRAVWCDPSGNRLYLSRFSSPLPAVSPDSLSTRTRFFSELPPPSDPKDLTALSRAVHAISPVELSPDPVRPRRSHSRNFSDIRYWPSTNLNFIACAFRPRTPERNESPDWYLAVLELAPGESTSEAQARFDDDFLDQISIPPARSRTSPPTPAVPENLKSLSEPDLLARDLRRSVANYPEWNFAASGDVVVLDNLDPLSRSTLVPGITNNLPLYRKEFASRIPSPLSSATNTIAVVRVFSTRSEYLSYVGEEHQWSAALWDPVHRELVLHLPESGAAKLLRTVWHESFHQYLAYACAAASAPPWFNEGHAELFENSSLEKPRPSDPPAIRFEAPHDSAQFINANARTLAGHIPALLLMDYADFYSGAQEERLLKYRLAWSLAYFLEIGAPEIRFQPYQNLRRDHVRHLVQSRNMLQATQAVLDEKSRDELIAAWLAFWTKR